MNERFRDEETLLFTYLIDNFERTSKVEKKASTKGGGGGNGNSLVFEPRQQSLTHTVTTDY